MIKVMSRVLLSAVLLVFLSGVGMAQQAKPEHPSTTEHPKAEQAKPDHPKAEQAKPDHPKQGQAKPDHPKAEQPKPDHPKAEPPK
jgi:hypothetical protein